MSAMQEPTFLILTALAARPLHGYGVIQEVSALSGGEVVLRAGTLYGALDRLTEQDLIAVDREEAVDGRLRRYYRLTDRGAGVLATEIDRLRRNAAAATTRLGLRGQAAGGLALLGLAPDARDGGVESGGQALGGLALGGLAFGGLGGVTA
jgi:DNA-binding PadR family transcriptional regulator